MNHILPPAPRALRAGAPPALAILVLLSLPAAAAPPPVVANGASPAQGLQVVQLEELWRAGGGDDDMVFGHIFRAEGDADGNVYLLDTQLSEVPMFSPTGEHLRTLSREGEGPGETRGPVDLTMMPDGTLGILQRFPAKIVKVDRGGGPVADVVPGDPGAGGFNSLFTGRCRGDNLMVVGVQASLQDRVQTRTWYVARLDAAGRELARCWERDAVVDFDHPVIRESTILDPVMFAAAPGAAGRVYVAPDRERYAIEVHAADGSLERVIEREFTPRRRTELETGRVQAVFDLWAGRNPAGMKSEVEPVAATVSNLYVDGVGRLWVEHSRSGEVGPPEAFLTFDVFDADGGFERQVALVCPGDPVDDRLFWVRDDLVVIVRGAVPAMFASMAGGAGGEGEAKPAEDEMEVVCYRVPL